MHKNSKYAAFISYSSRDRALGRRVQTALENYRVPKALIGRQTSVGKVPRKLGAFFRDRTDLRAGMALGEELISALESSDWLLVVCSPNSASSKWVNSEIETFASLGKPDKIFGMISEGTPKTWSKIECPDGAFPPSLSALDIEEIYAPDLRDVEDNGGGDGFDTAILKVVSAMLDVPLAELTQRHYEEEKKSKRQFRTLAVSGFTLALLAALGGWTSWLQTRAANERLLDAINSASSQVEITQTMDDRFGLPSSAISEMFESADKKFGSILQRHGGTDQLLLAQANLNLALASFARKASQQKKGLEKIEESERILMQMGRINWQERLGLIEQLDPVRTAAVSTELQMLKSSFSSDRANFEKALSSSSQAMEIAKESGSPYLLRNATCHFAQTLYLTNDNEKSEASWAECVDLAKKMSDSEKIEDQRYFVTTLSDHAKLLRRIGRVEDSLRTQENAAKLAKKLLEEDSENLLQFASLFQALLLHGDVLMMVGDPSRVSEIRFLEALELADRASALDVNRTDWKRNVAMVKERLASLGLQNICGLVEEHRISAFEEMLELANASVVTYENILGRNPLHRGWRRDLATSLQTRSNILAEAGLLVHLPKDRRLAALQDAQMVIRIHNELIDQAENPILNEHNAANAAANYALLSASIDPKSVETKTAFEEARRAYESLLGKSLTNSEDEEWRLEALFVEAFWIKLQFDLGKQELAEHLREKMIISLKTAALEKDTVPKYASFISSLENLFNMSKFGEPKC